MKRRTFIKFTSLISAATFLPKSPLMGMQIKGKNPVNTLVPFLPMQGSPYRKNCDSLDTYNDVSFRTMMADIIHYRTPAKCRDILILGIRPEDDIT